MPEIARAPCAAPGAEALELVDQALLLLRRRQRRGHAGQRRHQRVAHPAELRRQRLRLVGVVAAEQLVAAVARQRHRDVLARQLRHA